MLPSCVHSQCQNELPGMRAITTLAISSSQKLLALRARKRNKAPSATMPQSNSLVSRRCAAKRISAAFMRVAISAPELMLRL